MSTSVDQPRRVDVHGTINRVGGHDEFPIQVSGSAFGLRRVGSDVEDLSGEFGVDGGHQDSDAHLTADRHGAALDFVDDLGVNPVGNEVGLRDLRFAAFAVGGDHDRFGMQLGVGHASTVPMGGGFNLEATEPDHAAGHRAHTAAGATSRRLRKAVDHGLSHGDELLASNTLPITKSKTVSGGRAIEQMTVLRSRPRIKMSWSKTWTFSVATLIWTVPPIRADARRSDLPQQNGPTSTRNS